VQGEGKSGLDAVISPPPAGSKGVRLIKAYQKDPQKFKRYAEMLDIATNAKQVGDVRLRQATLHPLRTSESPLRTPPVNPNIGYFSARSPWFPLLPASFVPSHSGVTRSPRPPVPRLFSLTWIKHWRTLRPANLDTQRPHVLTTSPMNFWHLGTVT
jgi:hypothetical protein